MRRFFKTLTAFALTVAMLATNGVTAFAETQTQSGTEDGTKQVEVKLDITSEYIVSLPAIIELEHRLLSLDGSDPLNIGTEFIDTAMELEMYMADITYGCAGRISPTECIHLSPAVNTMLRGVNNPDLQVTMKRIYHLSNPVATRSDADFCTYWKANEVGTCSFDGTKLVANEFSTFTIAVGFKAEDLTEQDSLTGYLTFSFGIDDLVNYEP